MYPNNCEKTFISSKSELNPFLVHRTWKILREHVIKPGCILVTVPSLEEATVFNSKVNIIAFFYYYFFFFMHVQLGAN